MIRFVFCASVLLCLYLQNDLQSQCQLEVDQLIADTSVTHVFIEVSGLLLDSLDHPDQGVCGVEIEFRHSYVGDLQIELISPEGHSVILVGSFTSAINPTNLITWDVTFLPCGFPVAPDPGFSPTWNNNQDWEILNTYSGSYHPNNGCLEDFDTGPANGLWQIRLTDNNPPQSGQILSVTLIFCDNTGINCTLCSADGGTFPDPSTDICLGESLDATDLILEFPGGQPDPGVYRQTFLLTDGQNVLEIGDMPETSALQAGNYQICGLSYNLADSMELAEFLVQAPFDEISTTLEDGNAFCADLSDQCLSVVVLATDTTFTDAQICEGQTYMLGNNSYSATGMYEVMFENLQGCDSIVILDLLVEDPGAVIAEPGDLDCNSILTLDGTGSTGMNPTFSWTALQGNILSNPGQPTVDINSPGFYQLVVSANGCADTAGILVQTGAGGPFAHTGDQVITCSEPLVQLEAIVFPTNVEVSWTGPGGFASDSLQPHVSTPGTYFLEVVDSAGCVQSAVSNVTIDTIAPATAIEVRLRDCEAGFTRLVGLPAGPNNVFQWSGPGGYSSTNRITDVQAGGIYYLTVIGENGCSRTTQIFVSGDYTIPSYTIDLQDDSLNCNEEILISVSPGNPTDSIVWITEQLEEFHSQTLTISEAGTYLLQVISENGCLVEEEVVIYPGADLFSFSLLADTLDCNTDTVQLEAVGTSIDSITWTGPGLLDSTGFMVYANMPGIYQATMFGPGGCIQTGRVRVRENYSEPRIQVVQDTITCTNPVAEITFTSPDPFSSFYWITPSNDTLFSQTIQADEPGSYRVRVFGSNGCSRVRAAQVRIDTVSPVFFLQSDLLGCTDSIPLQILTADSLIAFEWSGPGNYQRFTRDAFASQPGNYTLLATATNGCQGEYTIQVDSVAFIPEVEILGTQLNCLAPDITLQGLSIPQNLDFQWTLLSGEVLSTSDSLTVDSAGIFIFSASGMQTCTVSDTFEVLPLAIPEISLVNDTITCYGDAGIHAFSSIDSVTFDWTGPQGFTSTDSLIQVGVEGDYTLTLTAPNGCASDTTFTVEIDTIQPVAVAFAESDLRCAVQEVEIDGTNSVGDSLEFSWSSLDGNIVAGDSTAVPVVDAMGTYVLQVFQPGNGCSDTDTILVQEIPNPLVSMAVSVLADCFGEGSGSVAVDSVYGADSGLTYILNGALSQHFGLFEGLSGGTYSLEVADSFGCTIDTMVFVPSIDDPGLIDLGPDLEVSLGDSAMVHLMTTLDSSDIDTILWDPPPAIPCEGCIDVVYLPTGSMPLDVTVVTESGCVLEDQMFLRVVERATIYIPNAFSPNEDGVNDHLEVFFVQGVERVLNFRVFDRWGNVVYHVANADPLPGQIRWDGRFKGKTLNPGVYAYVLECELINGKKEVLWGDITLVR